MSTEALDKARERVREIREAGGTIVRLDPIEKAAANPKSLRAAVTAKCWDCVGRDADPNPRQRIRDCVSRTCPLVNVRPYQKRGES